MSSYLTLAPDGVENLSKQDGKTYDPLTAYGQSNAARVIFVKALAEKLGDRGVRVFSIDPGGKLI
jgi:NAD(P)-dependent dehydrogenase (short-subunit alcohol dehydrogenase family)